MNPPVQVPAAAPDRGAWWLAFAWGLAESTFFFIVPDVLSSRLVLQKTRTGFAACLYSLVGAQTGGFILYFAGQNPATADGLLQAFDFIPGISPALGEQSRMGLQQQGAAALFAGFVGGIPYKLYAVQAAGSGLGLLSFVGASAIVRLARFLIVTAFAWVVGSRLLSNFAPRAKLRVHAASWILFYLGYFWRMGL